MRKEKYMNAMQKTTVTLLAYLMSMVLLGQITRADEREMGISSIDINRQIENADAIIVARLVEAPLPYEVLGRDFYRFETVEVLAGNFERNSYLVLITNVYSTEGTPVKIEKDVRHLMFLKKKDLSKEGLPSTDIAYSLLRNWKGFLPLSPNSAERRFQMSLKEWHDIDASSLPIVYQAIKAAAKGLLDTNERNGGDDGETKKIPQDVQNIARKLGLENRQRVSPENKDAANKAQ